MIQDLKKLIDDPMAWTHIVIIALIIITYLRHDAKLKRITIEFNGKDKKVDQ